MTGEWNHSIHYHDRLLAAVPGSCRRALDVGCGHGRFARRVAAFAETVDALEADRGVIAHARELSPHHRNFRFIEADFMTWTADESYDFISMIAVLHHLPFSDALTKATHLLRPGGVLAVLGVDVPASVVHAAAQSLIAYPLSWGHRLVRRTSFRRTSSVGVPIRAPTMTFSEFRRQADTLVPHAILRRHVLWRYSLIWTKRKIIQTCPGR